MENQKNYHQETLENMTTLAKFVENVNSSKAFLEDNPFVTGETWDYLYDNFFRTGYPALVNIFHRPISFSVSEIFIPPVLCLYRL